tara:strand:+ start:311 stop:433 length:123 start_codon:yes stop_codon:yes gene_type:complete
MSQNGRRITGTQKTPNCLFYVIGKIDRDESIVFFVFGVQK